MTQKELTKKIIKDANRQAHALIAAAEANAATKLAQAQTDIAAQAQLALEQAQAERAHQAEQQAKAHEVAQIKAQINAQQAVIDQAFAQARTQLVHAPADKVQTMVAQFTAKYAKPGDQITVGQAWAAALPKLPVAPGVDAGIIIENNIYRLELTVDAILAELRAQLTPKVAEILGVQ